MIEAGDVLRGCGNLTMTAVQSFENDAGVGGSRSQGQLDLATRMQADPDAAAFSLQRLLKMHESSENPSTMNAGQKCSKHCARNALGLFNHKPYEINRLSAMP